jgi:hypothetical protein
MAKTISNAAHGTILLTTVTSSLLGYQVHAGIWPACTGFVKVQGARFILRKSHELGAAGITCAASACFRQNDRRASRRSSEQLRHVAHRAPTQRHRVRRRLGADTGSSSLSKTPAQPTSSPMTAREHREADLLDSPPAHPLAWLCAIRLSFTAQLARHRLSESLEPERRHWIDPRRGRHAWSATSSTRSIEIFRSSRSR